MLSECPVIRVSELLQLLWCMCQFAHSYSRHTGRDPASLLDAWLGEEAGVQSREENVVLKATLTVSGHRW